MQYAYKEVVKQLFPMILFPSTKEYRMAMENYLSEHANYFIDSIEKNSWISLFEEKLLPEVSNIGIIKILKNFLIIIIFCS